jgi:hypothetical protein
MMRVAMSDRVDPGGTGPWEGKSSIVKATNARVDGCAGAVCDASTLHPHARTPIPNSHRHIRRIMSTSHAKPESFALFIVDRRLLRLRQGPPFSDLMVDMMPSWDLKSGVERLSERHIPRVARQGSPHVARHICVPDADLRIRKAK